MLGVGCPGGTRGGGGRDPALKRPGYRHNVALRRTPNTPQSIPPGEGTAAVRSGCAGGWRAVLALAVKGVRPSFGSFSRPDFFGFWFPRPLGPDSWCVLRALRAFV